MQFHGYDQSIAPTEALLLQYIYSEAFVDSLSFPALGQLFQLFPSIYGPSISHRSLRYAALVFASGFIKPNELPLFDFKNKLLAQLRQRLLGEIDEGVLFTCFLMALQATEHAYEFEVHVKGVLFTMRYLSIQDQAKTGLRKFWPLIRDALFFFSHGYRNMPKLYLLTLESFHSILGLATYQQLKSYEELLVRSTDPTRTQTIVGVIVISMQQVALLKLFFSDKLRRTGELSLLQSSTEITIALTEDLCPTDESSTLTFVQNSLHAGGMVFRNATIDEAGMIQNSIAQNAQLLLLLETRRVMLFLLTAASIPLALKSDEWRNVSQNVASLIRAVGGAALIPLNSSHGDTTVFGNPSMLPKDGQEVKGPGDQSLEALGNWLDGAASAGEYCLASIHPFLRLALKRVRISVADRAERTISRGAVGGRHRYSGSFVWRD